MSSTTRIESEPSVMSRWWTVFLLFAAFTFSYMDRTVLSLVIQPLKHDLHLSDVAVSLLSGFAFAIFYAASALPTAWLSDRGSRNRIVAAGIAFWSLATALCGAASTFVELFLARMLVGAGESTLQPAAFSLIADLFPKERRGAAYAAFGAAVPIGTGLALIGGGLIIRWASEHALRFPALGIWHSWQVVFFVVGLPGFALALLALTMTEPRRAPHPPAAAPHANYIPFVRANARLLAGFFVSFSFAGMLSVAFSTWGPAFFIRRFGLDVHDVGIAVGLMTLAIAPCAALLATFLISLAQKSGRPEAPLLAAVFGMIVAATSYALAPLMPSWEWSLAAWGSAMAFGSTPYAAAATALPLFVPQRLRAQISALYLLVVTIIAIAAGPTVVALVTDCVFRNESMLGQSLSATAAFFGAVEAIILLLIVPAFRVSAQRLDLTEAAALTNPN